MSDPWNAPPPAGRTFTVVMLSVLYADFAAWLASRDLAAVHLPAADEPDTYIVVPANVE